MYIQKAETKGRTKQEVDEIIQWLTGYDSRSLTKIYASETTLEQFFKEAPCPNPNRNLITGSVCGIKVQEIEDPIVREVRYMDKLIDELAKGRPMEKILRS